MIKRRSRIDWSQMRITRGALVLAGLEIGLSLIWMLADRNARATMADWLVASPSQVFEHARVWTLATSAFLQPEFLNLLLHVFVLWMFVPTLERFWGTTRFYRFVAITSLVGSLAGCAIGLATGRDVPITGLSPFVNAAIIAFGVIYARQPVQFFGVLPLSGRQLMWGFIAFDALFVLLQGMWEQGAAWGAAMVAAAVLTSKRWSPSLAWKKWRIARARARLGVIDGGQARKKQAKQEEHKWLN